MSIMFLYAPLKKSMRFRFADQDKRRLTIGAPFGKCGQFAVQDVILVGGSGFPSAPNIRQ